MYKELKEMLSKQLNRSLLPGRMTQLRELNKISNMDYIDFYETNFFKNCKSQRKREAKICQGCPFRKFIEALEEEYNA